MKKFLTLLLIIFLINNILLAQSASSAASSTNSSAFSYSGTMNEQDQLKIYTYIWGQIQKPGLYIVPDDTDLLTLISLAGGPKDDAKLKAIKIVRNFENGSEKIIIVDMKKYISTGNSDLIPKLMPGDTVIIPGTSFFAVARIASFLANIAVALSVIVTIKNF